MRDGMRAAATTSTMTAIAALTAVFGAQSAVARETPSSGCGIAAPATGSYSMLHMGVNRTYGLRIPAGYDPRRPARLVLVFHGWGGDEGEFTRDETVAGESDRRGYVLVAARGLGSGPPDNSNNSWTFRGSATGVIEQAGVSAPICDTSVTPDYRYASCRRGVARNGCSWTQCQDDDVDFVRALVHRIERTLCIDRQHVFASGGSNGGMFTWELGQNPRSAPLFRAIAPIIGLPHRGDLRPPGRPDGLPVMLVTGLSDGTVPPGRWDDPQYTTTSNDRDRFYYSAATAITRRWAQADGCSTARKERRFETGYAQAECRTYCGATAGAWPKVLDCRAPMGHEYDLSWSWKMVLDFFDRF
jgi:poly(3-hydroxybutyrate) depolymerase